MPGVQRVDIIRWQRGQSLPASDVVAVEAPVAISYHGVPYAVMLATPGDLVDFGYGFTLTESLVDSADEIRAVQARQTGDSNELEITVTPERFAALLQRRRNMAGRSGCGLCGTETIEQAMRVPRPVANGILVGHQELHASFDAMKRQQQLNAQSGSVHAAAWCLPGLGLQHLREDVGRHNALDKVIGALIRAPQEAARGYLLISSRASYEMVLKSAVAGVTLLAAISAPTALAIEIAQKCGLTLVGFARDDSHVIYTHPERLATLPATTSA
jgi:formate dehydrogenase accessory protein FdhD